MSKNRTQELREQVMRDVAAKAERGFADTRFNWLRSRTRRRALVVASFLTVIIYGCSQLFDWPLVGLPALLVYGALLILTRVSTRAIVELPDEVVDERMQQIRGRTYRYAFLGAVCLMSMYLVLGIANTVLAKFGLINPLSAQQLHDVFFAFFFASIILPSAIFAWTEREV